MRGLLACMQSCQTEWDQNQMENSELTKLRDNYSLQLEEQVTLARLDIVNALQEQIQVARGTSFERLQFLWVLVLVFRNNKTCRACHENSQLHQMLAIVVTPVKRLVIALGSAGS